MTMQPPARNCRLVGVVQNREAARLTAKDCAPSMVVPLDDGRFAVWKLGVVDPRTIDRDYDDLEVHADELHPYGGAA